MQWIKQLVLLFVIFLGRVFFEKVDVHDFALTVFGLFFFIFVSIVFFVRGNFFVGFKKVSKFLGNCELCFFCLLFNLFVMGFEQWEKNLKSIQLPLHCIVFACPLAVIH